MTLASFALQLLNGLASASARFLVAAGLTLPAVVVARPAHSTRWFIAALVLSLGGFALLVLRQPRHRDETDDGARI